MKTKTSPLVVAFWIVFVLAMIDYVIMLFWSLPVISAAAGGLAPFDMRPTGYTYEEARAFLAALPAAETDFYRNVQSSVLDTIYPGLLGFSLFLAIGLLARRLIGVWGWLLALIALPGSIFDYMENVNIRLMLFLGPDNITPGIVETASSRTTMKAMFTTGAMSVLLVLILVWAWNRFRPRKTIAR